jgi:hypothetical protein
VKDVVAHVGALFWMVVDPSTPPDADGAPTEEANEVHVATHRPMTPVWSQLTGFVEDPDNGNAPVPWSPGPRRSPRGVAAMSGGTMPG